MERSVGKKKKRADYVPMTRKLKKSIKKRKKRDKERRKDCRDRRKTRGGGKEGSARVNTRK